MDTMTYFCKECGGEKTVEVVAGAPECCGEKMTVRRADPPPHPMTAEADRLEDEDDAFDDGVH
jgi:hypothetical protein